MEFEVLSRIGRIGMLVVVLQQSQPLYGLIFDQPQSSDSDSSRVRVPERSAALAPALAVLQAALVTADLPDSDSKSSLRVSPIEERPAATSSRVVPLALRRATSGDKSKSSNSGGASRSLLGHQTGFTVVSPARIGYISPRSGVGICYSRSSHSLAGLLETDDSSGTPSDPLALSIGQLARPRTLSALEEERGRPSGDGSECLWSVAGVATISNGASEKS